MALAGACKYSIGWKAKNDKKLVFTTNRKEVIGIVLSAEKTKNVVLINNIFESLSEKGKIMMIAYSSALRDKEIADKRAEQAAEPPALVVK